MLNEFNLPQMLTINDTAKQTKLSSYFIRQLVLQKKIKFVKSGKKFFVNLNSLRELLNNGEKEI